MDLIGIRTNSACRSYPTINSPALPLFTYMVELMTRSQQRPSWLSWSSVALDSRGREFDSHRRPWSCIRNWSRMSLRKFTHSQLISQPEKLHTDKGTEFTNRLLQRFLKYKNILFFATHNHTKASIVERFNRTLKGKMWKYFIAKNTLKYIDVLQKLIYIFVHATTRDIAVLE